MSLAAGVMVNQNVRLTRLLGQGGMGAVWLADHLTLRTQVAVKFILADYTGDEAALERFTREATSAAQIKSPNVVQVFDHGIFAGLPYIVMEYLEGEDLDARIERGPLSLGELGPILQQVGKALTQAHAHGIVHRDIKPANVYLTTAGDDLLVKLLDFGVAKSTRGVDESRFKKTQTGQLVGTPCFMSPEQIFSRGDIDYRVDLWALAVLVYEALTGALPFEGNTLGDIYISINNGTYVPPRSLDRAFPAELDAWFKRAFARDLNARFGSARELSDAFLAIAARAPNARRTLVPGAPVLGAFVDASGQAGRHGTLGGTSSSGGATRVRGRLAIGVGAVLGAACAAGLAVLLLGKRPATSAGEAPSSNASASAAPTAVAEVPAPEPVVSAAPLPASAAPPQTVPTPASAASTAPSAVPGVRPVKTATPVRPPTKPTGPAKSRDHGF
jgi:serine/threonine-protein kinase